MFACEAEYMTATDPGVQERDQKEVAASEAELHRLEPELDEDVIQRLVAEAHQNLMPAKVHAYVPILIVRQVRETLHGPRTAA
jgi:imidazolonepropionase-like amidohydrolase